MTKYFELVKLFSQYKKKQFALFVLGALAIISNLFFVYQIQGFVDLITTGTTLRQIWKHFFIIMGIGLSALVIGVIQN